MVFDRAVFMRKAIFLLLLLIFLPKSAWAADEVVLALPFENISGKPEYNWIGEGFSRSLANLLSMQGLSPIDVEERDLAYERLGLTSTAVLTRASAIKVGEKAGADLLVLGTYNIQGEGKTRNLSVTSRVIDLREGHAVGSDYTFSGPVSDLQTIQGKLAWEILYQRNPGLAFSREQLIGKATAIPSAAYESYVKALLTPEKEDKIKFLFRSLTDYQKTFPTGQFTLAMFTLGHLYYDDGNYKDAIKWLEKVGANDPQYLEAQFYRGVAYFQLGDTTQATAVFKPLMSSLPLYEVFNNAAVTELRKNNYEEAVRLLGLAIQAAPRDEDLLFNYGYTLWRSGQFSAAANQLNQLVRRESKKDGQAYYILGKSLEKMEQKNEATAALDEAKKNLTDFAKWETSGKVPQLGRVKDHYSRAAFQRLRNKEVPANTTMRAQAEQIDTMLAKAQGYFIAGHDAEAVTQLNEVLKLKPDNAEGHLLLGRIKERTGDTEGAITALKAAIFWNAKLVPAHVLLGRIYLQQKKTDQAKAHLKLALDASPQDREALALQRLIADQQ